MSDKFQPGDILLYKDNFYCQKCIVKIIEKYTYLSHTTIRDQPIVEQIVQYRTEVLFVYYAKILCNYKIGLIITVPEVSLLKLDLITLCQERLILDNIIRSIII